MDIASILSTPSATATSAMAMGGTAAMTGNRQTIDGVEAGDSFNLLLSNFLTLTGSNAVTEEVEGDSLSTPQLATSLLGSGWRGQTMLNGADSARLAGSPEGRWAQSGLSLLGGSALAGQELSAEIVSFLDDLTSVIHSDAPLPTLSADEVVAIVPVMEGSIDGAAPLATDLTGTVPAIELTTGPTPAISDATPAANTNTASAPTDNPTVVPVAPPIVAAPVTRVASVIPTLRSDSMPSPLGVAMPTDVSTGTEPTQLPVQTGQARSQAPASVIPSLEGPVISLTRSPANSSPSASVTAPATPVAALPTEPRTAPAPASTVVGATDGAIQLPAGLKPVTTSETQAVLAEMANTTAVTSPTPPPASFTADGKQTGSVTSVPVDPVAVNSAKPDMAVPVAAAMMRSGAPSATDLIQTPSIPATGTDGDVTVTEAPTPRMVQTARTELVSDGTPIPPSLPSPSQADVTVPVQPAPATITMTTQTAALTATPPVAASTTPPEDGQATLEATDLAAEPPGDDGLVTADTAMAEMSETNDAKPAIVASPVINAARPVTRLVTSTIHTQAHPNPNTNVTTDQASTEPAAAEGNDDDAQVTNQRMLAPKQLGDDAGGDAVISAQSAGQKAPTGRPDPITTLSTTDRSDTLLSAAVSAVEDSKGSGSSSDGQSLANPDSGASLDSLSSGMSGADNSQRTNGTDFAQSLRQSAAPHRPTAYPPPQHQLAIQMQRAVQDGTDRFSIQMRPLDLGRIEVQLEIGPEGTLRAKVIAESPETLQLLQKDSKSLEKALQDAGLKTDGDSLSFSLQDPGDQAQRRGDDKQDGYSGTKFASTEGDDEDQANPAYTPVIEPGRVDVLI